MNLGFHWSPTKILWRSIPIESKHSLRSFTAVTRWALDVETVVTHSTHYEVLDDDFDAISDNMMLWYGMSSELGRWGSRWPDCSDDLVPASALV